MTRKSQELKNKILKNLTDWCFDPLGDLVHAKALVNRTYWDENSYHFRYYSDDKLNPNWRTEPKTIPAELSAEDYQEVKEAVINEIKQSVKDWEIEKEGRLVVVKNKSGRKHWKSKFSEGFQQGFRENEWKEIENILSDQQQEISPNLNKEQQSSYDSWTKEQLIAEINRLKTEIEQLKNNQTLTSSEKQESIKKSQVKLERVQSFLSSKDAQQLTNNSSLTPLLIGGVVIVVIGLVSVLVIKKTKKIKKSK